MLPMCHPLVADGLSALSVTVGGTAKEMEPGEGGADSLEAMTKLSEHALPANKQDASVRFRQL